MVRIETMSLADVALVHTEPFVDQRGEFARFYCEHALQSLLGGRSIKQINFSSNRRGGTLRGLHYQEPPHTDMKFVRCLRGRTFHVVVDIRPHSPTFLRWTSVELDAGAMTMVCVPEGFAHGFQSLQNDCQLMYFVTSPFAPAHQAGLRYNDPALAIKWPLEVTELSERDQRHPLLSTGAAA